MRGIVRGIVFVALIACLAADAGCGGDAGLQLPLQPATGTLKINGKPAAGIYVRFEPTGDTKGFGALGRCDDHGKFTLTDRQGGAGAVAGEYKVVLAISIKADGSDLPKGKPPLQIPLQYLVADQTPIQKTIPQGGGSVDIEVNFPRR